MAEHRDRREDRRKPPPEPYEPTYRGELPDEEQSESEERPVERDQPDNGDRERDR